MNKSIRTFFLFLPLLPPYYSFTIGQSRMESGRLIPLDPLSLYNIILRPLPLSLPLSLSSPSIKDPVSGARWRMRRFDKTRL